MLSLRAFAKNVGRKSVRRLSVGKAKVDVILRYVSYLGNSFIYLVGFMSKEEENRPKEPA